MRAIAPLVTSQRERSVFVDRVVAFSVRVLGAIHPNTGFGPINSGSMRIAGIIMHRSGNGDLRIFISLVGNINATNDWCLQIVDIRAIYRPYIINI